jgi:AcrR family transcriptional regulator
MKRSTVASKTPAPNKTPAPKKARRARGRPRATQAVAGRDTIVAAARRLMDEAPPHQATISSIARNAGVDPALVRYYFKNREQLLLAVIEDILDDWNASHPLPAASPAARLGTQVGEMLDFARRVRSMQRLMIDECASSRSAEVRRRVRDINAVKVDSLALLLHPEKTSAKDSTDPLFLYVAILGLCEFFAASQALIQPLAPAGLDAEELAARYKKFIVRLVLDGMRERVEPWSARERQRTVT